MGNARYSTLWEEPEPAYDFDVQVQDTDYTDDAYVVKVQKQAISTGANFGLNEDDEVVYGVSSEDKPTQMHIKDNKWVPMPEPRKESAGGIAGVIILVMLLIGAYVVIS